MCSSGGREGVRRGKNIRAQQPHVQSRQTRMQLLLRQPCRARYGCALHAPCARRQPQTRQNHSQSAGADADADADIKPIAQQIVAALTGVLIVSAEAAVAARAVAAAAVESFIAVVAVWWLYAGKSCLTRMSSNAVYPMYC